MPSPTGEITDRAVASETVHRSIGAVVEKLNQLRTELADQAFLLETRGQLDAADLAIATAFQLGEICDEFTSGR